MEANTRQSPSPIDAALAAERELEWARATLEEIEHVRRTDPALYRAEYRDAHRHVRASFAGQQRAVRAFRQERAS